MLTKRSIEWLRSNAVATTCTLTALHLILALLAFHQAPFSGGDDAIYVSLAKSLISGHGYIDIWDPAQMRHTMYPPIFPIVVAIGLLSGLTLAVGLKLLMIAITTAAVAASSVWLQRVASPGVALFAGFFIAISPEVIRLGQVALSDGPFWLFGTLALLLWRRADLDGMASGSVIGAAAVTLAAYFTRSAGAPLLLATLLWLAWSRQPRAIAIVAGMSMPLILAWWYRGYVAGAGGYLSPFLAVDPYNPSLGNATAHDLVQRFGDNANAYASRHLSRLVFGNPTHRFEFGIPFVAAVFFGWAKRLKKISLAEIWLPLYVAVVVLWPTTWSGARFLLPIVPLIALYVAETIDSVAALTTFPGWIGALVMIGGSAAVLPTLRQEIRYGRACRERYAEGDKFPCADPGTKDFLETAELVRGKLPDNSVVISRKPAQFYLYSGYRSRIFPLYTEPDSLLRAAARIGAEYVVEDRIPDLAAKYLHPAIVAKRDNFCVMPELSMQNATFMRIEPGGTPDQSGTAPNALRVCDRE